MMLHNAPLPANAETNKKCKQLKEQVAQDSGYHPEELFRLLLYTAQFEFKLKEVCSLMGNTFASKHEMWV